MHEKERHRIIVAAVQERPVVTVPELVELTSSSEATIRRDIAALHVEKRLRRVRGGLLFGHRRFPFRRCAVPALQRRGPLHPPCDVSITNAQLRTRSLPA